MSVPKISTMVTFRQRRFELVDKFVTNYREEVAEALELLLEDDGGGGGAGTLPGLFDRLLGRLRQALANLVAAEKAHLDEIGDDAAPRRRRDEAARELRQALFDLRGLYLGVYGETRARQAGFERRIAKNPLSLLRQGQRVHDFLSDGGRTPGAKPAEPRYEGLEVPAERVLALLGPRLRELREAIDEVVREQGRAQGTKVAKDKALGVFDETYLLVVRMLASAFRLAGHRELAAKIPTSLRRPRRGGGEGEAASPG